MNGTASSLVRGMVAAALLACAAAVPAQTLDLNMSNDSALFRYIILDRDSSGLGSKEVDLGLVYSTDDAIVGMFGAQLVAEAGSRSPGLDAGLGLKLFGANADVDGGDDVSLFALTLGGQLHFVPPPWPRIGVSLEGFFSPDVVTFGDADKFAYLSAALEYRVLPQAMVYLGYRKMRAGLEEGDNVTVESGGHLGFQLEF
ncbi:MAG: YfaZ family outer membrane protein [Gammaproteobacteria bacterium]